jgi:hypothetical protein
MTAYVVTHSVDGNPDPTYKEFSSFSEGRAELKRQAAALDSAGYSIQSSDQDPDAFSAHDRDGKRPSHHVRMTSVNPRRSEQRMGGYSKRGR